MSKITISKLARMSQREFVEIREAVTEGLKETRSDVAAVREEIGALRAEAERRFLTLTDGLQLILQEVDELASRRRPRRGRARPRSLRTRRAA